MPSTTPRFVSDFIYPAAMAFLDARMNSPEAKALILAIGMQESGFAHRTQIGGPAHGFWQFEEGHVDQLRTAPRGSVNDVLGHEVTKPIIDPILPIFVVKPWECFEAITYNDILACILARLLLWSHPPALPRRDNAAGAWNYYLDTWRPGKPHRATWDGNFERAWGMA